MYSVPSLTFEPESNSYILTEIIMNFISAHAVVVVVVVVVVVGFVMGIIFLTKLHWLK